MRESDIQRIVKLEACTKEARLWRNNSGAAVLRDGSFVRWGLANESEQMNTQVKSSDLIGIRRKVITQADVGKTVGVFVAREIKPDGWAYKGTPREKAQKAFIDLINDFGGDADFATGEGTL